MKRFMLLATASLFLLSCATLAKSASLEVKALRALCADLRSESTERGPAIVLVYSKTQPIYLNLALRYEYSEGAPGLKAADEDLALDRELASGHRARTLDANAPDSGCPWKVFEGTVVDFRGQKGLHLELSNFSSNPYTPDPSDGGFFARLSAGAAWGSWYWVEVPSYRVVPLQVSDG